MHYRQVRHIYSVMSSYTSKGKKSAYKRKQMRRLIQIIDDILSHEPISQIHSIGRRQMIGYWQRHEHESHKTRMEKYHILVKFFAANSLTVNVTVPKPRRFDNKT
ncbi:hypothetical protein [Vibrio alfacsensis]|uniref:hypothetical protein n=1 Tax=Vibrio alfacsensis TaxID=1074311 RepID=UPI004068CE1F